MPRQAEGTLTAADESTTLVIPFMVPTGIRSFRLKFNYTPDHPDGAELRNQISASIYGPDGKTAEINRPDRWPDGVTGRPRTVGRRWSENRFARRVETVYQYAPSHQS